MKNVILALTLSCGIWVGTQMSTVSAQTGMSLAFIPPITNRLSTPLTGQAGFTNTLTPTFDLSTAQLADVATLLLSLQTNVELTLPVISTMASNASLVANSTPTQFHGFFTPMTTSPGTTLSPTGAASGANTAQPVGISITLGTSTFTIDQPTFQALLALRDDLQRALPALQVLNGTTLAPTNASGGENVLANPPAATTNFGHITNSFASPLTNDAQVVTAPNPF